MNLFGFKIAMDPWLAQKQPQLSVGPKTATASWFVPVTAFQLACVLTLRWEIMSQTGHTKKFFTTWSFSL